MPMQQMLVSVGGGGTPGESSSTPITDGTTAAAWNSNTGGDQLAWIQKSGINGGSPLQVYCQWSNGWLWGAAGRWDGSDNTASNASGGRYRWCTCKNPNASDNDWGMQTHTFNPTFNKFTGSGSARTRLWFEADCNRTRFLFSGIVGNSNPTEYTMNSTQKWGQRMEGESDYYRHGSGVTTGDKLGDHDASQTGTPADDWKTIGRQVSDGENTTDNTNDVFMIVFCAQSQWDGNAWQSMNGLGWKRSGASGQWPRTGDQGSEPTFDTVDHIDAGGNVQGNHFGVIAEDSNNGDLRNQPDGKMIMLVNLFN